MEFSEGQLAEYEDRGVLFFPGLLHGDEVAALQAAMSAILSREGPEIIREKGESTAARLAFGAHAYSEPFRRLAQHPRILGPVRQLLRDEVYLHQSRINPKEGFGSGASWDWHQDFPGWYFADGMPEPRCAMVAVFIDNCTAATSPLLVVPGSQRHGLLDAQLHRDAKGYALYQMDREDLKALADAKGIEALIGPAGSVCFCHSNLVHGSANNVSPWRRAIAYLIYNAVSNACAGEERPEFQNNRDFTPLQPLGDDCLQGWV
jgi:ectoine hydroxylase